MSPIKYSLPLPASVLIWGEWGSLLWLVNTPHPGLWLADSGPRSPLPDLKSETSQERGSDHSHKETQLSNKYHKLLTGWCIICPSKHCIDLLIKHKALRLPMFNSKQYLHTIFTTLFSWNLFSFSPLLHPILKRAKWLLLPPCYYHKTPTWG